MSAQLCALIVVVVVAGCATMPVRAQAERPTASFTIPADQPDATPVCDAQRRCITLGAVRALVADGDRESEVERLRRENIDLQEQLAIRLAEISDLQRELGPLRAPKHREVIAEQRAKLQADAEARTPGYTYDPRTGVRVKKEPPKKHD